jgi:hypothetical protein
VGIGVVAGVAAAIVTLRTMRKAKLYTMRKAELF